MNSISTKIVLQQVALWCVLVVVVVLLTLLFTILGTITCAVLMGMMLAANRQRRWQAIPVSLIFPGVVVALVQFAKVDLPGLQRVVLPVLCFLVFWLIYLLALLLIRFEAGKDTGPTAATATTAPENLRPMHVEPSADSPPAGKSALEPWQGTWTFETTPPRQEQRKVIEVVGSRLSLSVLGTDGHSHVVARADLRLEDDGLSSCRTDDSPTRATQADRESG